MGCMQSSESKKNRMATATTERINDDKHELHAGINNNTLLKEGSIRPLPLTEERRQDIKETVYTQTSEIRLNQHQQPSSSTINSPLSSSSANTELATTQNALILQAVKEKYTLVANHAVPSILHPDEVLIEVSAIGLNPIDWKAPAFNFGIPSLPWVFGRDLAGTVVKTSSTTSSPSRLQVGDIVLVPSTDYRDIRKAAFQEYAIATNYNAARIPATISIHSGASLGVAYVAAALALGVSFGLDFGLSQRVPGPDLRKVLKDNINAQDVPEDVRGECFPSSSLGVEAERVQKGDWIAIWGASTTTGYIILQLAKLCGLRVICIADIARHGHNLYNAGADILVDRYDTNRVVEIVRGVTKNKLRFGIDVVGRETAIILEKTLFHSIEENNTSPPSATAHSHLLGLTGVPKEKKPDIIYHTVPIKIFHSCPEIGEKLVRWLERLLETNTLTPPDVVRDDGGLAGINDALDLLRSGTVSGKRIVVNLKKDDNI